MYGNYNYVSLVVVVGRGSRACSALSQHLSNFLPEALMGYS